MQNSTVPSHAWAEARARHEPDDTMPDPTLRRRCPRLLFLALVSCVAPFGPLSVQAGATVSLSVPSDLVIAPGGTVEVPLILGNDVAVRAIFAQLRDLPNELSLVPGSSTCAPAASGFSCPANEVVATNLLNLVLLDTGGGTIAAGNHAVMTLQLQDDGTTCSPGTDIALQLVAADVSDADSQELATTTIDGMIRCDAGATPSPTTTATITPSASPTATTTITPSATLTVTATITPNATPTVTATITPDATPTTTTTPSATGTASATETPTATNTPAPTGTPSSTVTASPSGTSSATATPTASATATPSTSGTSAATETPPASNTPASTETPSPTGTASVAPSPASTPSATTTPLAANPRAKRLLKCQTIVFQKAAQFTGKRLKALDKCDGLFRRCAQRTAPGTKRDTCFAKAAQRCASQLTRFDEKEAAKLRAKIVRKCGTSTAPFGVLSAAAGIGYAALVPECAATGIDLLDAGNVAECIGVHHDCQAQLLHAASAPRTAELMRVAGVPDELRNALTCLTDYGGDGAGIGDLGTGKAVDRCATAVAKASSRFVSVVLGELRQCVTRALGCRLGSPGELPCIQKATSRCQRAFAKMTAEETRLRSRAARRCAALPFGQLATTTGVGLELLDAECSDVGTVSLATLDDYVSCLIRRQRCRAEALIAVQAPRAGEVLQHVGQTLTSPFCP